MAHDWEMDIKRAKLDINVMVWRCKNCGCLQIKNGGLSAQSIYRPNEPMWNPFKTLQEEPPCEPKPSRPVAKAAKRAVKVNITQA